MGALVSRPGETRFEQVDKTTSGLAHGFFHRKNQTLGKLLPGVTHTGKCHQTDYGFLMYYAVYWHG